MALLRAPSLFTALFYIIAYESSYMCGLCLFPKWIQHTKKYRIFCHKEEALFCSHQVLFISLKVVLQEDT